jgi:hypothetical protein
MRQLALPSPSFVELQQRELSLHVVHPHMQLLYLIGDPTTAWMRWSISLMMAS